MPSFDDDRRHYFRIEDRVILLYRHLSETALTELDRLLRSGPQQAFSLTTTLAGLSQESQLLIKEVRLENPVIARYLEVLESKLEILGQALLPQEGVAEEDFHWVNLSAGGVEFQSEEPIASDVPLELKLMLLPNRVGILAGGRVIRCESESDGNYRVAVEFVHIRENDRQLIAKHILNKQAFQLREYGFRSRSFIP